MIRQLRYRFRALETISFGAAGAANDVRGALGWNLRRVAGESGYARLFAPPKADAGPSGFADRPRPFVLRASHLDGAGVAAGETFQFDLHLFETGDRADTAVEWLGAAFEEVGKCGIGVGRGKAELAGVEGNEIQIELAAAPDECARLRVEFLTATELKVDGEMAEKPDFGVLFARVRDRVATLQSLYGGAPLTVDFAGLGERAGAVAMERCELRQVHTARRSSRTGQTHELGGFAGEAIYSGSLAEFRPWLQAAEWTGVGRQTVWGKGQIRVTKV